MSATAQLTSVDRDFFRLVATAAFSNPFSDERVETDRKIAGVGRSVSATERIDKVMEAVAARVRKLEDRQMANARLFSGEDREILLIAFLFDVFHRFLDAFDKLIQDQLRAGDTPLHIPFARDALSLLEKRGVSSEGMRHFLAVFYQLRRAYFFIDRGLVGQSACMKDLRRRLWNNVFTHDIRWYERYLWDRMEDFSTLLLGETGTGKGAAAASIGRSGYIPYDDKKGCFVESFTRSFIAINLSQFPPALIESELFGHRKGSFTGAIDDHEGLFARCSPHGAIFLDEIGDATIPVQVKLLHVLQERAFSPVGSHEKMRFRGRVVAATNRPLSELRRRGDFRDDFFYRLSSDVITVPPLRQRLQEAPGEMQELLEHLVQRLTGDDEPELAAGIHTTLKDHPGSDYGWPGNVRELEQAVRRIMLTRQYEGDYPAIGTDLRSRLVEGVEKGTLDADTLLATYCALLYERHPTYEEVALRTRLDRRTVKKYILAHHEKDSRVR